MDKLDFYDFEKINEKAILEFFKDINFSTPRKFNDAVHKLYDEVMDFNEDVVHRNDFVLSKDESKLDMFGNTLYVNSRVIYIGTRSKKLTSGKVIGFTKVGYQIIQDFQDEYRSIEKVFRPDDYVTARIQNVT